MFSGTTDTLTIRTSNPEAEIFVNDALRGHGSVVAEVDKKDSSVIRVEAEGCKPSQVAVAKKFDPVSLLGILIDFGIISILIVDYAATGSVNKAKHTNYVIEPICPDVDPVTAIQSY